MSTAKKKPAEEERSLESRIMGEPWFRRLNELQSRWVPNTEENRGAYESLMSEVMLCVYTGCMQLAVKKYDEFVCTDAMFWVISDLKNYNPELQSLGKYISYHIRSRMQEAYSRTKAKNSVPSEPSEFGPWHDELTQLEKRFPEDSEKDHARWVEEVHSITYAEQWKKFERFTPEQKKRTLAAVKAVIAQYRPGEQSLVGFMEKVLPEKVRRMLNVPESVGKANPAKTAEGTAVVLVPIHRNDDEDENFVDGIPDPGVDVEEKVQLREAAQAAILALVLNFTNLKKNRRDSAVRHYRMFYTEQVTGSARILPLPEQWGRDILRALHQPYFRYFMADVEESQKITLQTIRRAKPKKHGEVIPGKRMDEYLPWDRELFLPANVQMLYLQDREQVSVSAATVSTRRKEYRQALSDLQEN